jgi:hypothetical protein
LAQGYLVREREGHVPQTMALVNEAFVRLLRRPVEWQDRAHFFGVAATLIWRRPKTMKRV